MKKLLIFDYDGTLIDSMEDAIICLNKVLENNNIPKVPKNNITNFEKIFKAKLEELINVHNFSKKEMYNFQKEFSLTYLKHSKNNTKPFPKITKMLESLQDNNYLLAINSNKNTDSINYFNKKFFEDIDFKEVRGYRSDKPPKPDPTQVFEIIKNLEVAKEESLYIGDSVNDILTAKNAGVDILLVSWGQSSQEDLKNDYIKKIVNTPQEICEYLSYL